MRIAFYAPMKPPDHPSPSGDRLMARQFMVLMERLGHEVFVASRLVTRTREPDPQRLFALASDARTEVDRILAGPKPDLWFTYHLYHKAPDLIGPVVANAFGIPYVVAEASYTPSRDAGPWATWQEPVKAALRQAAAVICMTRRDMAGLEQLAGLKNHVIYLPPFLLAVPAHAGLIRFPPPGRNDLNVLTVAMMRPGHKNESYRLLAEAMRLLPRWRINLTIVGDGSCRHEVEARFAGMKNVRFLGALSAPEVEEQMAKADVFIWPGIGEAYGMVYLEAQAAGLPVVALDQAGVPDVVQHEHTGLLVPYSQTDSDASGLAAAVMELVDDKTSDFLLDRYGRNGQSFVREQRSPSAAASALDDVLQSVVPTARTLRSPVASLGWQLVVGELDLLASSGRQIDLWLRDDDAVSDTPALQRLESIFVQHDITALLAIIPSLVDASLANLVNVTDALVPCQHGFSHTNHAREGEKKIELADHSGIDTILGQLSRGSDRLRDLFPDLLPILVPPWNRIGHGVTDGLASIGFRGLSVFGRNVPEMQRIAIRNTHIDLMDWRAGRRGKDSTRIAQEFRLQVWRATGKDGDGRIGILAHHLVHDDNAWQSLEQLLALTRHHPAVRWRHPRKVFGFE